MTNNNVMTLISIIVIGLVACFVIWAVHGERMKVLELKHCIEQVEQK